MQEYTDNNTEKGVQDGMENGLRRSWVTRLLISSIVIVGLVAIGFVVFLPRPDAAPAEKAQPNLTQATPKAISQLFDGMTDGQTINGDTVITFNSSTMTDVVRSELYVDDVVVATSYAHPFNLLFVVAGYGPGEHTIYVKTYSRSGEVRRSATIKIVLPSAPSVSETAAQSSAPVRTDKKDTIPEVVSPGLVAPPAPPIPIVVPPTTPTGLTVETANTTETRLRVSWQQSTDESGIATYNVYRNGTLLATTVGTDIYDRTVVPGATYSYAVEAVAVNINKSTVSSAVSMQLAPASIWDDTATPTLTDTDATPIEVGLRFRVHSPGTITGLRFYKGPGNTGVHTISLWDESNTKVATGIAVDETADGWQRAYFDSAVAVDPSLNYTISYSLPNGHYSFTGMYFVTPQTSQYITALVSGDGGGNGVFNTNLGIYPSSSFNAANYWVDPIFIPDVSVGNAYTRIASDTSKVYPNFPGSNNTGVPVGQELALYTGRAVYVNQDETIDGKVIYGGLRIIGTSKVTVTNSKIYGHIDIDGNSNSSLTLRDTTVDAGEWTNVAIGFINITMERVNSYGGTTGISCSGNCSISDSWLHGQYLAPGASTHLGGFLSNGGSGILLSGNTISCDIPDNGFGGGCSGAAQLYGDFAINQNVTFDGNLFVATTGAYCTSFGYNPGKPFGSNPANIIVKNNIWQRGVSGMCGGIAATTSFLIGNGNQWTNNRYDDGAVVNP